MRALGRGLAVMAAAVAVAILGYGYWHQATHGWLHIGTREYRTNATIPDLDLTFLDADGRPLARARAQPPHHAIFIVAPEQYACQESEQRAMFSAPALAEWQRCVRAQTRWVSTWARQARAIDVQAGGCVVRRAPVTVRESTGQWWLWWVPVIGGTPYRYFDVSIEVDRARCIVLDRD